MILFSKPKFFAEIRTENGGLYLEINCSKLFDLSSIKCILSYIFGSYKCKYNTLLRTSRCEQSKILNILCELLFRTFSLSGLLWLNNMSWNTIPCPSHFQLHKLFGDLHVLVKDAVLLVSIDILDGFGIHSQNNAICDERFPGGMIGYQFIFWLNMFPGFPT